MMRGLGLFRGQRRNPASGIVVTQIFSDTDVSDWSANQVTFAASAQTNPEDGGLATDVLEQALPNSHGISRLISFVSGTRYRVRLLVRGINESIVAFSSSVDAGGHYLYIDFTTGANLLSQAVSSITQQSLGGGWYVVSFEMDVTAAGGAPDLYIGISKPGPNPNFVGVPTDGITIGSVRIYQVGA